MRNIQQIAKERQVINQRIRLFFEDRNFTEVETPIVVRSPGMESNLTPFETKVIEPDGTVHHAGLITSPEYAMKKLLGQGMRKIFTITKVFRNHESLGGHHNPEFSMLEWYSQGEDYQYCMQETQELIQFIAKDPIFQKTTNSDWDFSKNKINDLFKELLDVNLNGSNVASLRVACTKHNITTQDSDTESDLFYRLFLEKVEPTFKDKNIFIYDYPKYQASLAKLTEDKKFGQRFELFMNGLEICNGFTELTDPDEQRARFAEELKERKEAEKQIFPIDEELLQLLPSLQSPTYGNALGIDRLHMVLTGKHSIEDTLLFTGKDLFIN
jgi:elongation factor P--(R)-beta-lysine ligase